MVEKAGRPETDMYVETGTGGLACGLGPRDLWVLGSGFWALEAGRWTLGFKVGVRSEQ